MPYFFVLFGAFLTFFFVETVNIEDIENSYVVALHVAMQNLSFINFINFVCATCFVVYDLHLDAAFDSENKIFQKYLKEYQEAADKEDFEHCAVLAEAYDKFAISRGRMF